MAAPSVAAPSGDSPPPWRLGTPHDSLNRFASLLGTFVLRENQKEGQQSVLQALVPNHSALKKLLASSIGDLTEDSPLSFPSLSLLAGEHHAAGSLDKRQVEANAALNLARPLVLDNATKQGGHAVWRQNSGTDHVEPYEAKTGSDFTSNVNLSEVPNIMLDNLAGSFVLLVEARLRAYIAILARHGVSLAESPEVPEQHREEAVHAVERKLACLLDIGSRISMNNMVTSFQPQPKLGMSRCVNGVEEIMVPVVMSAVLDMTVPNLLSGHERVTVSLQAAGAIKGTCTKGSALLESVCLELNTQQLMSAMVQRAARVSSIALNHVNEALRLETVIGEAVPDTRTTLPSKRHISKCHEAAALPDMVLPVVSPDLNAMLPPTRPSPLNLGPDDAPLSDECCANIVDCVIGEIKDDFMTHPLSKKRKIEPAPLV